MNQYYDRIPILYEGQIQVVDPITRQPQAAANIQSCTDRLKNLFEFDMDQEDQLHLFLNIAESTSPCFCFSNL